ncbi:MAG: glycoside hydrolase family 13 protein [Clostridia bacterium]|nr:glycoside hydrolase family 13 protein [Clostridia bacterium]
MERIRFDTTNKIYKNPFGALPTDCICTFTVDVLKEEAPETVQLSYRADGTSDSVYIDMNYVGEQEEYLRFSCDVSFAESGLYFYRFQFSCPDGIRFVGKKDGKAYIEDWLDEWQLTVYDKNFQTPAWAKGATMYQIFPDRFCRSSSYMPQNAKNERKIHENWFDVPDFIYDNPDYKGNDYFCGNLKGICERLPYIKELGVDVIYLNPVFESPENHRYSTGNYENIDPYLGTNEDFEELCQKAKDMGIRVILDGVFSHTGADSIYFNKYGHYDSIGACQGEASPYYHWYSFNDSDAGYECWWGFENLPNVNEAAPDYLQFITGEKGVLEQWQNRGASGWRLDVADELPDVFIDALRSRVKQTDSDALIIGEVWEDATNKFAYGERRRYLLGQQLDSVMNYPWRTAIIDFVKWGHAEGFKEQVLSIMENYPTPVLDCLMNILSTHDTERIINVLGVDHEVPHSEAAGYCLTEEEYKRGAEGLRKAAFLQFVLPGVPSIYYGDEVGLTGFRDPYCRMGYPYGKEDEALLSYFKALGDLRKTYRQDFVSPVEELTAIGDTVSFVRGDLFFVANMGKCDENVKMKSDFVTIFGCENVKIQGEMLTIPAGVFGVLRKK